MKKRDQRYQSFRDNYLDVLAQSYDIEGTDSGTSFVFHNTELGTFTFFPKSDKIQLHENSEWVEDGLSIIKSNLRLMDKLDKPQKSAQLTKSSDQKLTDALNYVKSEISRRSKHKLDRHFSTNDLPLLNRLKRILE